MNGRLRSALHAAPYVVAAVAVFILAGVATAQGWRINVEGFKGRGETASAIVLFGLFCIWWVSSWLHERSDHQWPKRRRRGRNDAP